MKQKIMETGIHLFHQNGFKSTSVQDIVQEMGVTKGTFYYYFSSKEELLKDIHLSYIEEIVKQQEVILKNNSYDFTKKLYEIIFMLINNIQSKGPSARIFTRENRHLNEKHVEEIKEKRAQFRRNTQKLVEEGINQGVLKKEFRADILTLGILGMTNWSYYWFNPDGEVPVEKVVEIFLDMVLNGISNPEKVSNSI
ncbi:TetR/AcrR family transcriptional regulator [Paenibacillus sp. BSR1-1]|uniref:TetR/AcrR family transcriptional regulator n=1 Tax=Paenibacillus sp. BSR1-1 TaxID=3020845 RepID=UPI0025B059BB|nr:TetR/AcrR family transcriptional regulator [Paenibacillus sp. BSR1-1]MDN3015300.1 TetR/AcrR family transcriptional regulator [Paenibacillus sp. BSR1-1]